ncbi:MAG: PKD domain-containing protein, partial [Bacteroidales bacterium]|nr:PKD domain-containing protein [Bacteroidales bacterium]
MYQLYADCLHIENNRGGDINVGNQTPDQVEEIRIELAKQIFVRNVVPTLAIAGEFTSKPGIDYVLNLSSSDPGDDTITSWLIDWGDGTEQEFVTGNPKTVTHIYATSGLFTISATATDEDGTWNANTIDVEITVPAIPWISGDPEILEGREYVLDLHRNNTTITQWIINWGDGSETEIVDGSLDKAFHFYADGDES